MRSCIMKNLCNLRRTQAALYPMTFSEINQAACQHYQLFTQKPRRALRFERNIRFFVEYLLDEGKLEMVCHRGVTCYQPPQSV